MKKALCLIVIVSCLLCPNVFAFGENESFEADENVIELVNSKDVNFDSGIEKEFFIRSNENSSEAIGLIGSGEIKTGYDLDGNSVSRKKAVAKASVTKQDWSGSYLTLNYDVYASSSIMLSSTCMVEIYSMDGSFITNAPMIASSRTPTSHLSSTGVVSGLGSYDRVKVVIKNASVYCDDGLNYPLPLTLSSFIAYR